MFQHAFVLLIVVAQSAVAPPPGVSLGDAARRIREERKQHQTAQDEIFKHVLQVSGLDKEIDAFPDDLSEGFSRQMATLDPRFSEKYRKAVLASFTADKIRSTFTDTIKRQMGYSDLTGVLPWYESPLGRKVTAAENRDPDAATHDRNRAKFAAGIQKEPPTAQRIRLIREMEAQLQSTDHIVSLTLALVRTVVSGIRSADPRIVELVRSSGFEKGFRDKLVPELEKRAALSDLYVYSTLSDAELEQYIQFLSSPHGQAMTRAVWSGLEQSIMTASADMVNRLADFRPEEP